MNEASAKQRVDRWLWCARMFRTRTLAAKAITAGPVRVNGERVVKPAFGVVPGDVITFARGRRIMTVRIAALATRRGPASEAQTLYEDLTPPAEPAETRIEMKPAERDAGSGRPTKKERRSLNRLRAVD